MQKSVPPPQDAPPLVSIVIKTLNEEHNIGRTLVAALAATKGISSEIILADSLSEDRTIDIAKKYPVRIVQLTHIRDRGCGAGPQLGYQHARGEFICLIDGDMALSPEFLVLALESMRADPCLAGVAGVVSTLGGSSYEFEIRKRREAAAMKAGDKEWLGGGGLYRRVAIEQVGYFSNRNLHAKEEEELGVRLTSAGWRLTRIPTTFVTHYAHADPTLALIWRRWSAHYVDGPGELLIASIGKRYFFPILWRQRYYLSVIGYWLALLLALAVARITLSPAVALLTIGFAVYLLFVLKKGGFTKALASLLLIHVQAAGLIRGLLRRHKNPHSPLETCIVQ